MLLDAFVDDFVGNLISEVKSELVGEAQGSPTHERHPISSALPQDLPFTAGSSAPPSPYKGRSRSVKGTPHKGQSSTPQSLSKPGRQTATENHNSDVVSSSSATAPAHEEPVQAQGRSQDQPCMPDAQAQSSQVGMPQAPHTARASAPDSHKEIGQAGVGEAAADYSGECGTLSADQRCQASAAREAGAEQPGSVELVHDVVQDLLDAVTQDTQPDKVRKSTWQLCRAHHCMTGLCVGQRGARACVCVCVCVCACVSRMIYQSTSTALHNHMQHMEPCRVWNAQQHRTVCPKHCGGGYPPGVPPDQHRGGTVCRWTPPARSAKPSQAACRAQHVPSPSHLHQQPSARWTWQLRRLC